MLIEKPLLVDYVQSSSVSDGVSREYKEDWLSTDFVNDWGSIRLGLVRRGFGYNPKDQVQYRPLNDCLDDLVDVYCRWYQDDEVIPIEYQYLDHRDNSVKLVYKLPIAAKRGNDQYLRIVKERLKPFLDREPITFFEDWTGDKRTNALYVTGTVGDVHDQLYYPSLDQGDDDYIVLRRTHVDFGNDLGYLSFGKWWNSFITNVRRQLGGLVFIRTWQSQENGRPHFHAILYFKDHEFIVVPHVNERGFVEYRLPVHSKDRKVLKSAWSFGFLDVKCIQDMNEAFKDLLKYVTRDLQGGESDLTNSLLWYFGRQAFGVSRDFLKVVWNDPCDVRVDDPSDFDLIDPSLCNSNWTLLAITIFPSFSKNLLPRTFETSLEDWKNPPPIDPNVIRVLQRVVRGYHLVECSRSKKYDVPVFIWRRDDEGMFRR